METFLKKEDRCEEKIADLYHGHRKWKGRFTKKGFWSEMPSLKEKRQKNY